MKKASFKIMFSLSRKQPWLNDVQPCLESLLYDECQDDDDRDLVLDLIEKFTYIEDSSFNDLLKNMGNNIKDISNANTQIVGLAGDSESDSSQYIVYGLKGMLPRLGTNILKYETNFQKAYANYKAKQLSTIILVDEFIGTGQTVSGRVARIKQQFTQAGIDENLYKIYVRVLVSTEQGFNFLRTQEIDIEAQILLKKGIDDYYSEQEAQILKDRMVRLESRCLSVSYNDIPMPSLGYGQVQATYYRKNINVPNSVFPIFWWSKKVDNTNRVVLIHRNMEDA